MADELDAALRQAVARTPVARLATIRPEGTPHLVPVTFALTNEGAIVTAVDHKPKTTTDLQRLRNIAATSAVSVLIDHDETDWPKLWWVRADGQAQIHEGGRRAGGGGRRPGGQVRAVSGPSATGAGGRDRGRPLGEPGSLRPLPGLCKGSLRRRVGSAS